MPDLKCPNCGASASLPLGMTCSDHRPEPVTGVSGVGRVAEIEQERALRLHAEATLRDLTSRLGFGDGITEPQADNDTIVRWFDERGDEASEWVEYMRWRDDCYAAGHSDTEDCWEHDPSLRLERAEAELRAAQERIERVTAERDEYQKRFRAQMIAGQDLVDRWAAAQGEIAELRTRLAGGV